MSKPTFAYCNIRAFTQHTRLLLQYLGVEYEDKRYNFGPAPEYSRDEWLSVKHTLGLEFPNLPYFIDGDVKLTESNATYKYIARTRGPQLVPTDALSLARSDMIEGMAIDIRTALVQVAFGRADDDLAESLKPKLEELNNSLSNKQYAIGDKIHYVDFLLYEVLYQLQKFRKEIIQPYANLVNYVKRIESLPQLADYVKATESLLSYARFAKHSF